MQDVSPGRSLPGIYMINVGVNTGQYSRARSPIFNAAPRNTPNFIYVPFYSTNPDETVCKYPDECLPFLNPKYATDVSGRAHADPDWNNCTYGDNCNNPRGAALRNVSNGDILLFWGLLCDSTNGGWSGFKDDQKGWYLLGVLRVEKKFCAGCDLAKVSPKVRKRALKNVHFRGKENLYQDNYVFVGDTRYSGLFRRAVDLQVRLEEGLIYRVFRTAAGERLPLHGRPRWPSALRCCRKVLDLNLPEHLERAKQLQAAINQTAEIDIFRDISPLDAEKARHFAGPRD